MSLRATLEQVQHGLPIVDTPELAPAVHWTPAADIPVHRWFRYREGFSPHLLNYFPSSRSRLDPFCGCGTTLLESAHQGIPSWGVDLNPLATFVARVKTTRYTEVEKGQFARLGQEALSKYRRLEPAPRPSYDLLEKQFLPASLDVLLRLRTYIDAVTAPRIHDLLMLVWLSILEESSNVFKEGNGLKYRNKRRRPGTYETLPDDVWIPRHFGNDIPRFIEGLWTEKCAQIVDDLSYVVRPRTGTPKIATGSCLDADVLAGADRADLVIFSPPYANRFDYFEAFKMELWMGGFVKSGKDLALLRTKSMRNNLAAKITVPAVPWQTLMPFLEEMDESASSVQMGIKEALHGYFEDMRILLTHLKPKLTRRGKVVIVVGNSAYAKSIIPTDALIARIGQEEGFRLEAVKVARHLHVSSQQRGELRDLVGYMRESVIVLEKQA